MERHDRTPVATFFAESAIAPAEPIVLGEAAAHHARVKRLAIGDPVVVTNGAGTRGVGEIAALDRQRLTVRIGPTTEIPRPSPIHLCAPVADRDRMLWLAEKATELGVASWRAVRFRRSMSVSPRGEGSAFTEKVRARMQSALEQSGGAWMPEILPDVPVDSLTLGDEQMGMLLDAGGEPIGELAPQSPLREPLVLIGPEGGIEPAERERLLAAGWVPVRLAPATLRFETAGIAALAVLRASSLRTTGDMHG
ncbi:MAG TPA: RsmE family RNA methyltransferase [Gemmatimonadaceae bacterium]|nr:RsmE family RNA methyltransferase [Gemmatimonadaceae bacterium]